MGALVFSLAEQDMESARVVMRRLMWNLNDESGGIGWGSPEAMGEIMARHSGLAEEYSKISVGPKVFHISDASTSQVIVAK